MYSHDSGQGNDSPLHQGLVQLARAETVQEAEELLSEMVCEQLFSSAFRPLLHSWVGRELPTGPDCGAMTFAGFPCCGQWNARVSNPATWTSASTNSWQNLWGHVTASSCPQFATDNPIFMLLLQAIPYCCCFSDS